MTDELADSYDVVVLGGGGAGLSGALMLGRSRRSVAVIDAGAPRNAPAAGVHGLLGREGIAPAELLEQGRAEVRSYGVHVVDGEVSVVTGDGDDFTVALTGGRTTRARRILVASGLVDRLPEVDGLQERWGRDVLHCPYCHGWEVRDQAIGVLASSPLSAFQALLFGQLSRDVTLFTHTIELADEQVEQLTARGIRIVAGEVTGVEVSDDRLSGVRLSDGTVVPRAAMVVSTRMQPRIDAVTSLGVRAVEHPSGMGEYVVVDEGGRTDVPGVWAAGNVADPVAQVAAAAAAGAWAGAQINADLVTHDAQRAVADRAIGSVVPSTSS